MTKKENKKKSQKTADKNLFLKKKWPRWVLMGLIVLATLLVFSNSIRNGFVNWDDDQYVYTNTAIQQMDGQSIRELFTGFYAKMYAPVTMMSYALDYQIGERAAAIYHATNLIIHLANVALVFYFLYLLTGQAAIAVIAALFFGIHPLHVESVAWISERKDLLYSYFYLCGLITYISYSDSIKKYRYYFFTIVLFLLSLLSKSAAVTFPLILVLIDYYKGRKISTTIKEKIPFFFLSFAFGVLSLMSQKIIGDDADYVTGYTLLDRFFLGMYSFMFYIIKSVFPTGLSALHPMPMKENGYLPIYYYLSVLFVLGITVILTAVLRSKINALLKKDIIFGLLFFIGTISLVLFIPVGQAVVSERYTYIPYIGIFFIFGRIYAFLRQEKIRALSTLAKSYTAAVVIVMIMFAGITFSRNKVWKDTESLFSDVIQKYPDAALAYNNRGNIRMEKKDYKGALEDFNKAITLKNQDTYNNRGILRNKLGEYQKAIEDFNVAEIHVKYNKEKVFYNRGYAKLNSGNYKDAEEDFGKAIRINPRYTDAYNNRGFVRYEKLADFNGAIEDFNKAIQLDPKDPFVYYNRGDVRLTTGKIQEAIADFEKSIQINPEFAAAFLKKGGAFYMINNVEGACLAWEKASELGIQSAQTLKNRYCKE